MNDIEQSGLDFCSLDKFMLFDRRFPILDSLRPKSEIYVITECTDNDFRLAASKIRHFAKGDHS